MKRRDRKASSKNTIYHNSFGEPWCECGNRTHIYGFYPCDALGNPLEGGDEAEHHRCDKCGAFVGDDAAEIREEPESDPGYTR